MNSNNLLETKQRLLEKLGQSQVKYFQLLGKWFRGYISSKEEFAQAVKDLIDESFVDDHNQFWLAFFQHCANNANKPINSLSSYQIKDSNSNNPFNHLNNGTNDYQLHDNHGDSPNSIPSQEKSEFISNGHKFKCLPSKVMTHMRIYVIAWEMGLDSVDDSVSTYIDLALHHFLKNIINEILCTKTGYRIRENRFRYAIGVKPLNPYLNNSLKVNSSNLEYDPYQIESNKMNSSLVDSYAYNDFLFPGRLYEAQALYELACSTTTHVPPEYLRKPKKPKLSEISLSPKQQQFEELIEDEESNHHQNGRRLTLFGLLMAFLSDKTILPSQTLYSVNLERILTKLPY